MKSKSKNFRWKVVVEYDVNEVLPKGTVIGRSRTEKGAERIARKHGYRSFLTNRFIG